MRTIAVEPTRLEACAGQIEQLRQEVERTVARLYERVELMAANTLDRPGQSGLYNTDSGLSGRFSKSGAVDAAVQRIFEDIGAQLPADAGRTGRAGQPAG